MNDAQPGPRTRPDSSLIPRDFGLPGAVMLSWMIAGGILAGGFLVAYGTFTERISGHALLNTVAGLYLVGSLIGAVLGGALGMFGRPIETAARRAFREQLTALLYALPALFIAFVVTGWIAMTAVAIYTGEVLPIVGVSVAYVLGFIAVGVALRFGWFGARRAWDRLAAESGRPRRRRRLRIVWEDDDEDDDAGDPRRAGS